MAGRSASYNQEDIQTGSDDLRAIMDRQNDYQLASAPTKASPAVSATGKSESTEDTPMKPKIVLPEMPTPVSHVQSPDQSPAVSEVSPTKKSDRVDLEDWMKKSEESKGKGKEVLDGEVMGGGMMDEEFMGEEVTDEDTPNNSTSMLSRINLAIETHNPLASHLTSETPDEEDGKPIPRDGHIVLALKKRFNSMQPAAKDEFLKELRLKKRERDAEPESFIQNLVLDTTIDYQDLGVTYDAEYLSVDLAADTPVYKHLTDDTRQCHVGFNPEPHQAHFLFTFRKHEVHSVDETGDNTSWDPEPKEATKKKEYDPEDPEEYLMNVRSGLDGTSEVHHFGISAAARQQLNQSQIQLYDALPDAVKRKAAEWEALQAVPIFLIIYGDLRDCQSSRVYIPPSWGRDIAEGFKSKIFVAVIRGSRQTNKHIERLLTIMDYQREYPSFKQWLTEESSRRRLVFTTSNLLTESRYGYEKEQYHYRAKFSFYSLEEYLLIMASGERQKMVAAKTNCLAYEGRSDLTLSLMPVPGRGSTPQKFLGFIPFPDSGQFKFSPGDTMKITFKDAKSRLTEYGREQIKKRGEVTGDNSQYDDDEVAHEDPETETFTQGRKKARKEKKEQYIPEWRAEVCQTVPFTPADKVAIWVDVPWFKDEQRFDDQRVARVRLPEDSSMNLDNLEILKAIHTTEGSPIKITIDYSEQTNKTIIARIESLNHPAGEGNDLTLFNKRMLALSEGKDIITEVGSGDILADIRDEFPDPVIALPHLYKGQRAAIRAARDALGYLLLISGPPGTGKSHIGQGIVYVYMRHSKVQPVLYLGPSNESANDTVKKARATLLEGQSCGKIPKDRYVLRAFSKDSEEQIRTKGTIFYTPDTNTRPSLGDASEDALNEVEKSIRLIYDQQNDRLYPDLNDPRVKDRDLSVGEKMLQLSGILRADGEEAPEEYADWRAFYVQKSTSTLAPAQLEVFKRLSNELYTAALTGASVIVTTVFQAGQLSLQKALKEKLSLLIIDEACRIEEADLIPVWAARFENVKGVIMIGDPKQTGPIITQIAAENPWVYQQELVFYVRMMRLGIPVQELLLARRSVKAITDLVSELSYGNRLMTQRDMKFAKLPPTQRFRDLLRKISPLKALLPPFMWVDFRNDDDEKRSIIKDPIQNAQGSKYNALYVIYAIAFLDAILAADLPGKEKGKRATVGVLCGYTAMEAELRFAIANMQAAGVPGIEAVKTMSFDQALGHEFDFGIIMYLVERSTAGFQADPRRLNVSLSRCRYGFIILGDMGHIQTVKHRAGHLVDLCNWMEDCVMPVVLTEKSEYPFCEYYNAETRHKDYKKASLGHALGQGPKHLTELDTLRKQRVDNVAEQRAFRIAAANKKAAVRKQKDTERLFPGQNSQTTREFLTALGLTVDRVLLGEDLVKSYTENLQSLVQASLVRKTSIEVNDLPEDFDLESYNEDIPEAHYQACYKVFVKDGEIPHPRQIVKDIPYQSPIVHIALGESWTSGERRWVSEDGSHVATTTNQSPLIDTSKAIPKYGLDQIGWCSKQSDSNDPDLPTWITFYELFTKYGSQDTFDRYQPHPYAIVAFNDQDYGMLYINWLKFVDYVLGGKDWVTIDDEEQARKGREKNDKAAESWETNDTVTPTVDPWNESSATNAADKAWEAPDNNGDAPDKAWDAPNNGGAPDPNANVAW